MSTMPRMVSRKNGVIIVSAATSSTLAPRRSSCATAKSPSSRNWRRYSVSSALVMFWNFGSQRCCAPISSERTDLSRHSSSVLPMPMTSPVAFICVPSVLAAVENLSNGKRGSFATT